MASTVYVGLYLLRTRQPIEDQLLELQAFYFLTLAACNSAAGRRPESRHKWLRYGVIIAAACTRCTFGCGGCKDYSSTNAKEHKNLVIDHQ